MVPAAVIKVNGKCMGGHPKPSMLLEIYLDGVRFSQGAITSDLLVIGQAYSLEATTTNPEARTVYGRMVLTNPLGSYEFLTSIAELGLTINKWYSIIPTGTAGYPERINDLSVGIGPGGLPNQPAATGTSPNWGSVGEYVELDFGIIVKLREFRYHGFDLMKGNGRWKITYWNLVNLVWIDWMTVIPTRYDAPKDPFTPWTTPPTGIIYTNKVRIIATSLDSGGWGAPANYAAGFEMRF